MRSKFDHNPCDCHETISNGIDCILLKPHHLSNYFSSTRNRNKRANSGYLLCTVRLFWTLLGDSTSHSINLMQIVLSSLCILIGYIWLSHFVCLGKFRFQSSFLLFSLPFFELGERIGISEFLEFRNLPSFDRYHQQYAQMKKRSANSKCIRH